MENINQEDKGCFKSQWRSGRPVVSMSFGRSTLWSMDEKKEIRKSQREESKHTAPQRRKHLTFKGFCSVVRSESDKKKKLLAVVAQGEARDSQTVEACHTYCAVALWENNECPCGPEYGHLPLNGKGRDCFDSNLQREQPWECVYLHVCMWMCKLDTERSELLSYSVLWAYSLQRSACFNRQWAGGNYIFACCVVTCRLNQAKPSFGSPTKIGQKT